MRDRITRLRRGPALVLVVLTAVFGVRVHAEEPEEAAAATRYLQIDEDAKGELASVDALAARQEWRKAIDICQKWIAGSPKMVLEARPGVYASVRSVAEQRLRSLPAPARLLYRAVHDAEAERLYRTAREERDVAAARRLAGEFALTTHGPAGMNLLGTLLLERGDAAGALDAWQRWASEPEAASVPEPERRRTAVKMALAAARLGDGAALRQASEVFGAKGSAVDAGGTAVSGADELDRLSRALLPPAAASRPATPADLDFERWGSPLWPGRSDIGVRGRRSYMPDLAYSCFGQLAEGVAYVATPEGTEAIDTATGRRIWQRTGKGYERDSYESFFALEFFCRVYPAEGAAGKRTVFSSAGLRLDALDAETGEPLWSRSRGWFGAIVAGGNVPGVAPAFTSPVVCCGHSACVIVQAASGSRYVVALDRATGAIRWWTGIGGGPSAEGARFAEPSDLAAVGSDLIFCSGAGVIGRCSASTGEVRWMIPYLRRADLEEGRRQMGESLQGLSYRSFALAGDSLLCLPADGQEMLCVRMTDGEVRWRKTFSGRRELIGSLPPGDGSPAERVVASGDAALLCLRSDTGATLWTWPIPEGRAAGLGVVFDRAILIPGKGGVYVIDPASGELRRFWRFRNWVSGEANILVDGDCVVAVSRTGICALGGFAGTAERLDRLPGAETAAVRPWLLAARARLLRGQGKLDAAATALGKAIEAAGKDSSAAAEVSSLRSELRVLCEELRAARWKAGDRLDAFRWMLTALRSSGREPYECRIGYRSDPSSEPDLLMLASGDVLAGRLIAIESGLVTFGVRGEAWTVEAGGVRQILLNSAPRNLRAEAPAGANVVVLGDRDRLTGAVSVRGGTIRVVRSSGSVIVEKQSDASVIALGLPAGKPAGESVYMQLRDGSRVSGVMRAFDGTHITLDVPACGTHRIFVDDVYTISNTRERAKRSSGGEDEDEFESIPD